jgi:hypothetical protein
MSKHTALRLVDTRSLDRQQWLEVRNGGIGSSDAATAVGLNPYKSQLELWQEKTGRKPMEEIPLDKRIPATGEPCSNPWWPRPTRSARATGYAGSTPFCSTRPSRTCWPISIVRWSVRQRSDSRV